MENFKYVVIRSGYVTIKGSNIYLTVGQETSKFVHDCYPNFVNKIEFEETIKEVVEPIIEDVATVSEQVEEPVEDVKGSDSDVEEPVEESSVYNKKKPGRKPKN